MKPKPDNTTPDWDKVRQNLPPRYHCPNCGKISKEDQLAAVFPWIDHLLERLHPGEIVPFGECECGALVHEEKETK